MQNPVTRNFFRKKKQCPTRQRDDGQPEKKKSKVSTMKKAFRMLCEIKETANDMQ